MKMTPATKLVTSALAASLALGIAVPASAAAWNAPGQLRQQIAQLDRQIDRAEANRTISRWEARQLEQRVANIRAMFNSYARGGFTRQELKNLDNRVDEVKRQLTIQKRDRDFRTDASRYNRYDAPRHR
jgi:chromosome segregation ATPase